MEDISGEAETPFVSREAELERLIAAVDRALAGQAQVRFIAGEAGSGKSTLVAEFLRRAQEKWEDLVVASGACNAYTGVGDAYLPFRNILIELTTEPPETHQGGGKVQIENKNRLRKMLKVSADMAFEVAPDVLSALVPGGALLARAAKVMAVQSGALERLGKPAAAAAAPKISETQLDQSKVLQQYTAFIQTLSKSTPLILFVDDLHWVDAPSATLFFHLCRQLGPSHVLLVGAYRANDLDPRASEQRHPLEQVVNESKRYFGDVVIDLDAAQKKGGRGFVDALVNAECPGLPASFAAELFGKTGGHPLFTIELLRNMRDRGTIGQSADGAWRIDASVDWGALPARVEGVIAERVSRLSPPLRDTANVACVEGVEFTAQVISRVQQANERQVLRDLSRELDKAERLVNELGEVKAGPKILSRFAFSHALVQQYLYADLGASERRTLNGDVGSALEAIYGERAGEIAPQLARHFDVAGEDEKAAHYLAIAAERALDVGAFAEAQLSLARALELAPPDDRAARVRLLYDMGRAQHALGDLNAAGDAYAECAALARDTGQLDFAAGALTNLARVRNSQGRREESQQAVDEALALARQTGDKRLIANALRRQGITCWYRGEADQARRHLEEALRLLKEANDMRGAANALGELGMVAFQSHDLEGAIQYTTEAVNTFRGLKDRHAMSVYLSNLGVMAEEQNDLAAAAGYYAESLTMARDVGARKEIVVATINLGDIAIKQGRIDEARANYASALREARDTGATEYALAALRGLADAHVRAGDADRAAELLGFVVNHPAASADVKRPAEDVVARLRASLPSISLEAALARSAGRDLEDVARAALTDV